MGDKKTVDLRDETEELLVPNGVRQHPAWVRLNDQLGWYDHKSGVNQKRYKQIQAAQIILATSIPVFSLIGAASGRRISRNDRAGSKHFSPQRTTNGVRTGALWALFTEASRSMKFSEVHIQDFASPRPYAGGE
jgi:hypothetical protein